MQAQSGVTESKEIFDDADFYTLLLKELVDQRMADNASTAGITGLAGVVPTATTTARKEAKVKRKVDTKASKGRKMRYTVHEKLQNFMAKEDRGTWGQRQVDELFGSLLGTRFGLEEADGGEEQEEDGGEGNVGEEALRLFRD